MERPELPTMPNKTKEWRKLESACEEYLDALDNEDSAHKLKNFVFESALELVYGPNVWEWVNSKL